MQTVENHSPHYLWRRSYLGTECWKKPGWTSEFELYARLYMYRQQLLCYHFHPIFQAAEEWQGGHYWPKRRTAGVHKSQRPPSSWCKAVRHTPERVMPEDGSNIAPDQRWYRAFCGHVWLLKPSYQWSGPASFIHVSLCDIISALVGAICLVLWLILLLVMTWYELLTLTIRKLWEHAGDHSKQAWERPDSEPASGSYIVVIEAQE